MFPCALDSPVGTAIETAEKAWLLRRKHKLVDAVTVMGLEESVTEEDVASVQACVVEDDADISFDSFISTTTHLSRATTFSDKLVVHKGPVSLKKPSLLAQLRTAQKSNRSDSQPATVAYSTIQGRVQAPLFSPRQSLNNFLGRADTIQRKMGRIGTTVRQLVRWLPLG